MKKQVSPPPEILDAVVAEQIGPTLRRVEEEIGASLVLTMSVWTNGLRGPVLLLRPEGGKDAAHHGEGRISFNETFVSGRYLFAAETIFRGVKPESGFSGFSINGEATVGSSGVTTKCRGWVIRYGVWEWTGGH